MLGTIKRQFHALGQFAQFIAVIIEKGEKTQTALFGKDQSGTTRSQQRA